MRTTKALNTIILFAVAAVLLSGVSYALTIAPQVQPIKQGSIGVPPAIFTNVSDGYDISNISLINPFIMVINGSVFKPSINYITPSYAGLMLNGSIYVLNTNIPVLIRQTPSYNFYAKFLNSSYLSKIQTANVLFYSVTRAPFYLLNSTYSLSSTPLNLSIQGINASVAVSASNATMAEIHVSNLTHSITNAPTNYKPLLVLNISISNSTHNSAITVSTTMNYSCSINAGAIMPYELINGTWNPISKYTLNRQYCSITFNVPVDPVVGVFQNTAYVSTTVSTLLTSVPTTISTTTVQPAIIVKSNAATNTNQWIIIVLVIVVIVILLYIVLRRPKTKKHHPHHVHHNLEEQNKRE
jgi:hypothetical protein